MVVGDDAQSIYSWRGADFENILRFPQRHPDAQVFKIETNYRSGPRSLAGRELRDPCQRAPVPEKPSLPYAGASGEARARSAFHE